MPQFESDFEEKFYNERVEKLRRIAELGAKHALSPLEATYPNSFRFTTDVPSIKAQYDSPTAPATTEQLEADPPQAAIAGRIVAIRLQGKAGFATLQQGGQRLQLYVRKDDVGDDAFELYKLLDLGDHIGVTGHLMRTRTGELTLKVATLTFLTKAMLPLPDKHSGLGDIELRYRRRYLDLFTDTGDVVADTDETQIPSGNDKQNGEQTRLPAREVFLKRAAILRAIRRFFDERGYLEVETPMLHTVAGGAAARPFNTHHNALDMPLSLRIAPELYLKRLVVGGFDRVYEINRNFRNEGVSTSHNPEFTMLEFYQAYANYHDLMDLTEELIKFVAIEVNGTTIVEWSVPVIRDFKNPSVIRQGPNARIDLSKWRRLSMKAAIAEFWPDELGERPQVEEIDKNLNEVLTRAIRVLNPNYPEPNKSGEKIYPVMAIENISIPAQRKIHEFDHLLSELNDGMPLGRAIATLFETVAEEHLIQPTIIYDFPLAVSPLSKVKPDEPDWVERFEFYIGGFEVGNAFSELNDPADQLVRFEAQVADKDPESMAAVDEDYVRALGYGLPPTAGEGIGIDRLTMLLTGSRSIRDVILFPLMRPKTTTDGSSE